MSTPRSQTWRRKVVPALDHATPADRPVVDRVAREHGWSKVHTPDFDTFAKIGHPVIEVAYFRSATFESGFLGPTASTKLDTVLAWFAAEASTSTPTDATSTTDSDADSTAAPREETP